MANPGRENARLLSSDQYDNDAPEVEAETQQQHHLNEDDDDDASLDGRTLRESIEHDHEVFDDDYEDNDATTREGASHSKGIRGIFQSNADPSPRKERRQARREARKAKRRKRHGGEGESEMVFEMEEGGRRTSSDEDERRSIDSAQDDLKLLGDTKSQRAVCQPD